MKKYNIIVIGAGESGTGAAVLARKKGIGVFVTDLGKIKNDHKNVLSHNDIPFEEGKHTRDRILAADQIIKSPGIPDTAPMITQIREKGIPVISEIEFASRYTNATKICITGSNGKTTTASLTQHILKKAGLDTCLAGNVGNSFAKELAHKDHAIFVLEISSFQLDDMYEFRAEIAVLLNITPDHLDRYDNRFTKYRDSKFRILNNQQKKDAFIYCFDDRNIREEISNRDIRARQFPFSITRKIRGNGAFLDDNKIMIINDSNTFEMTIEMLALQGKHNIFNSMAAGITARVLDIRKETIKESLSDFQNIPHRLEYIANVMGIEFVNDSKATNVNATWYALESMNKPVIWIAGGQDKGNDYTLLKGLVRKKVRAIVCLGLENSKIHEAFADDVERIIDTTSMEDTVNCAFHLGHKNDVVLLSPACASFDLFENYADRGSQFKNAVNKL